MPENNGFTLIELLVVVLIIGILSAVALPQYQKAVMKARVSEFLPWYRNVREGRRLYILNTGNKDAPQDLGLFMDMLGVGYYRARCATSQLTADGACVQGSTLWITAEKTLFMNNDEVNKTFCQSSRGGCITLSMAFSNVTPEQKTEGLYCLVDSTAWSDSMCRMLSSQSKKVAIRFGRFGYEMPL